MSEKENILIRYARIYEKELKENQLDDNEIERRLNDWIKDLMNYYTKHPDMSDEEFEELLQAKDIYYTQLK